MAQYRLWCTLCGLSGTEALPAHTGDPTNELVALQEHVVHDHAREVGLSEGLDTTTAFQDRSQHKQLTLPKGAYAWSINDVIWLHAEPVTGEDAEV